MTKKFDKDEHAVIHMVLTSLFTAAHISKGLPTEAEVGRMKIIQRSSQISDRLMNLYAPLFDIEDK